MPDQFDPWGTPIPWNPFDPNVPFQPNGPHVPPDPLPVPQVPLHPTHNFEFETHRLLKELIQEVRKLREVLEGEEDE